MPGKKPGQLAEYADLSSTAFSGNSLVQKALGARERADAVTNKYRLFVSKLKYIFAERNYSRNYGLIKTYVKFEYFYITTCY